MDVYAVVDKSKKAKRRREVSPQDSPVSNLAMDMYAVADERKKSENQIRVSSQDHFANTLSLDNKPVVHAAISKEITYDAVPSDKLYCNTVASGAVKNLEQCNSTFDSTYSKLDRVKVPLSSGNLQSQGVQEQCKNDDNKIVHIKHSANSVINIHLCLLIWLSILLILVITAITAVTAAFLLIKEIRSDLLTAKENMSCSYSTPTYILYDDSLETNLTSLSSSVNKFMAITDNKLIMIQEMLQNNYSMLFDLETDLNSSVITLLDRLKPIKQNVTVLTNHFNMRFTTFSLNAQGELNRVRNDILDEVTYAINTTQVQVNTLTNKLIEDVQILHVFNSCLSVMTLSLPFPNGMYKIRSSNGSNVTTEMCSAIQSCNGVTGGWRRVANTHITSTNMTCPTGFRYMDNPPSCIPTTTSVGCTSVTYSVNNTPYTCITGRIVARQSRNPDGFSNVLQHHRLSSIDSNYVDGVSLTYGSNPRMHIWTFTADIDFNNNPVRCLGCDEHKPDFVKNHFSCERTRPCLFRDGAPAVCNEPALWDGNQCIGNATFYRQLSQPTSEDIEMRVCKDQLQNDEEFLLTIIEIYVH